jgi:uncharacterized lipoprotein YmbA
MRWLLLKLLLLSLCACASTPDIQRYTLHSAPAIADATPFSLAGGLGVGPIELPESWRRGEVVVWGDDNQIIADSHQLWAGDPKLALSRVLASSLSQNLQSEDVWAHPWDTRVKPKSQILLVVESFGGQLGGVVELKVKWRLMTEQGTKVVATERQTFSAAAAGKTYGAYVAAINQLVNQLSSVLEQSVRAHLKSD